MTRLKRKAQFLGAYGKNNIEIFKNPTNSEILNLLKTDEYHGIRGVAYSDATCYIWGATYMHSDINCGVDINAGIHFGFEKGGTLIISAERRFDYEETKKDIESNMQTFKILENLSGGKLTIWNINDSKSMYLGTTLDKFLNQQDVKVARLNKYNMEV